MIDELLAEHVDSSKVTWLFNDPYSEENIITENFDKFTTPADQNLKPNEILELKKEKPPMDKSIYDTLKFEPGPLL